MTTDSQMARAQRKRQLIAEGTVHRAGLFLARRQFESDWQSRPASVQAASAAGDIVLRLLKNSAALQAIMPLLLGGLTAAVRRPRLRRLIGGTAVAAAVAATIRVLLRKRS